jgi:hypothetical protein
MPPAERFGPFARKFCRWSKLCLAKDPLARVKDALGSRAWRGHVHLVR